MDAIANRPLIIVARRVSSAVSVGFGISMVRSHGMGPRLRGSSGSKRSTVRSGQYSSNHPTKPDKSRHFSVTNRNRQSIYCITLDLSSWNWHSRAVDVAVQRVPIVLKHWEVGTGGGNV